MEEEDIRVTWTRKALRFLFVAMTIFSAVILFGDLAAWIISAMGGLSFSLNRAASIGIIGGADGPTSILIMSAAAPVWQMVIEAVILIVGILGWRYLKKNT